MPFLNELIAYAVIGIIIAIIVIILLIVLGPKEQAKTPTANAQQLQTQ